MSRLPLERFELFRSEDLEEVRELVGRVFVPHRLSLVGSSTSLDARMHTRRLVRVAANYMAYGGEVLIEPGSLGSFFLVQVPLTGHSTVRCGRQVILSTPSFASVVSPTETVSMRWSTDCSMLMLRIERPALEAHLRDMISGPLREPVNFALGMDVSAGYGLSWVNGFRMLVDELDRTDGSLVNSRIAARAVEEGLMTTLLLAQPSNYSARLDTTAHSEVPNRAVGMVRELIENHPEWHHTVASLARMANVGVRALQIAFARHLDMSPKEYLTEVRMQRAHEELRASQRDTVTVGHVARKWGLGHPGRFASEYRKRFGEKPSETLRK